MSNTCTYASKQEEIASLQMKLKTLVKERDTLAIEKFGTLENYFSSYVPRGKKDTPIDEKLIANLDDQKNYFLAYEIMNIVLELQALQAMGIEDTHTQNNYQEILELEQELERLSLERDELAVQNFGDLKTYAFSMPVPSDTLMEENCKDKATFLRMKITATETEINVLMKLNPPQPVEDYKKTISNLQGELDEVSNQRDQLDKEKARFEKLYTDALSFQQSITSEFEEVRRELSAAREKHNFASTLELLRIAELHKCYVHGKYVQDVIVPALRRDFGKCRSTSLHLVMENPGLLPVLLQNAGERLREYKDKTTLSECRVKKYYWFDSLGDITTKVRIYLEKIEGGYETESLHHDVYFIPSKNQIVTDSVSLSQFYSDCDKNIYRLSENGCSIIYTKYETMKNRYLDSKLSKLIERYTVITFDGKKLCDSKPVTSPHAQKIYVCDTYFWLETQ